METFLFFYVLSSFFFFSYCNTRASSQNATLASQVSLEWIFLPGLKTRILAQCQAPRGKLAVLTCSLSVHVGVDSL